MNKNKLVGFLMLGFLGIALFMGSSFGNAVETVDNNGETVYKANCMVCHGATGAGIPSAFPPIAKSDYLAKLSKTEAITIVLKGKTGEMTVNGNKFNSVMAPLDKLSDTEIADVLNYISNNFGNKLKKKYAASDVKKVRASLK